EPIAAPTSADVAALDLSSPSSAPLPDMPNEPPSQPTTDSVNDLLHQLDTDEPVTPKEQSGLIRTPSILSEPAIDVAAMNQQVAQRRQGPTEDSVQALVAEVEQKRA